jgi:hypothetical protein
MLPSFLLSLEGTQSGLLLSLTSLLSLSSLLSLLPSAPPDAVAAPPRPVTGLAPFSAADSAVALDQQREQADQQAVARGEFRSCSTGRR